MSKDKIQIGKHILANNAFLAPMAGITDASFRTLATRFGAGLVVSEMVASASLGAGQKEMLRRIRTSNDNPHVVQLSGNQAVWLELGAKMAAQSGADIIDINMGCPSKKVTNGLAGAGLMKDPDKALRLIEAVANATDLPITLKMRLGWDENNLNASQIATSAVNAGVKMIVVHGRTRQQFYRGKARWELVKPVVDAVNIPVVVNGDIKDITSAKAALSQSGAKAVMIGRAIYGQPWLAGQIGSGLNGEVKIKPPKANELLDLIIEHYEMMLDEYGIFLGVLGARKHIVWYFEAANIKLEKNISKALLTATDPKVVIAFIKQIFFEHFNKAA